VRNVHVERKLVAATASTESATSRKICSRRLRLLIIQATYR